jgi:hypothetical protein
MRHKLEVYRESEMLRPAPYSLFIGDPYFFRNLVAVLVG